MDVNSKDEIGELANSLSSILTSTLRNEKEAIRLTEETAVQGKPSTRADISRYPGDFQKL